jgi:hypothetical protein
MLRHLQGMVHLRVFFQLILAFASLLAERVAAMEITPMTEANSLLIRCENSRRSSRASEENRSDGGISINWSILHPHMSQSFSGRRLAPTNRMHCAGSVT